MNYSKTSLERAFREGEPLFLIMAKQMIGVESGVIRGYILNQLKLSTWKISDKIEEWKNMGYIAIESVGEVRYRLGEALHLRLFEQHPNEQFWRNIGEEESSLFDGVEAESIHIWLRKQMLAFLRGEDYLRESEINANRRSEMLQLTGLYYYLKPLLKEAMKSERWMPFMRKFTRHFPQCLYFYTCQMDIYWLKDNDKDIEQNYFLGDPDFIRNEVTEDIYNQEACMSIIKGDFARALQLMNSDTRLGRLAKALMTVYSGDSLGAVNLFGQLFPMSKESTMAYMDSFTVFTFAVCLKNLLDRNTPELTKVATKCLKWLQKDLKNSSKIWMELLAAKAFGTTIDKEKTLPKLLKKSLYPYDLLLTSIVLRYYYGYEEPATDEMREAELLVERSGYKLLTLELCHSRAESKSRYEVMCKDMDVTSPLQNGYIHVPKWERILDAMITQTAAPNTPTKEKTKTEKQARVIYNMWANPDCTEFEFTPRLQKSNDGIHWTGGRNIALKGFGASGEGLTELDIQISRHVKTYTVGWYGQTTYSLGGKVVLDMLVGHPNVYLDNDPSTPVQIVRESLQIIVDRSRGGFSVKTNIGDKSDIQDINVVRENNYLFKIIKLTAQQKEIIKAFREAPTFPKEAETKLTQVLGNISRSTTVMSDMLRNADSNAKQVKAESLLTVRLRPVGEGLQADLLVKPFGSDGPSFQPGRGTEDIVALVAGKSLQTKRNLKKEKEHLAVIRPILYEWADESYDELSFGCSSSMSSLMTLEALYLQSEHCRLEWPEGERFRIARRLEAKDLILSVKGAKSWFEVDGEIKVSEKKVLRMAELLERLHDSQGHFVQIGDNEFLALSDQLRKQLSQLEAMATVQRKKVQLSAFSTSALDALEQAGVSLEADKNYQKFIAKVHAADEVKFSFPKGLQAELRDYQREGVRWMARLASWGAGACLADDMGLGKTLQAITLMLARRKEGASLVVVPTSVTMNWRNEINRFAPQLNVLLLNTQGIDREKMLQEAGMGDIVIATYGLLVTEEERLTARDWNMIVLDEAHTIKNKETKMSHVAMQLRGDFRLLLTGTPLQNHLGELWNLFQFSNPGLLGSHQQFQEKFIVPIEKQEDKERMRQLKRLVTPFILRRTKNEVLDELPEKSEVTISVELSDEEMAIYENLRRQALSVLESGESTPMQTLAEITKLRQAACNVRLIDDKLRIESSKLTMLLSMVQNLITNGHRALVFSQFTSHLALVREALDAEQIEYLYLDGACTARQREQLVKQFQEGTAPLFLISLKAGGTGLNLTAADYVFHLDPWWNPAIEDQASDRTYRIGQTRAVTIYRLIAQQTIEEKILRLHSTKKSLADSLLAGTNASHKLTKEEILQLLG